MSPRTESQNAEIREKTRATILESALALFAIRGFHGTSIDAIASRADISKGLLYHYFAGKKKILEAIIYDGLAEIETLFADTAVIEDPFQHIAVLIERSLTLAENNEHFWRLYTSLLLQPDVWKDFQNQFLAFAENTTDLLEGLFRDAGVENPREEALLLLAIFDGVGLHAIINRAAYPLAAVKNLLIKKYGQKRLL